MATQRGQQLRNYINQFSEILVANRKLDVEAGINRVQEQVARGLVTPPTDEPLRDNRLYNDAWREARSENLGREAGQLLMDDTPSMIAESMEKFRFDDEEYSPSEQMTYLVNEWWEKHKANVGDTDLADHPAYQKQWESFKTRAYGALRDVVQTETVKQATGEARSIIQDRLGKIGYAEDPNTYLAGPEYYKNIRNELVGMKYPLLKSQLEGLIHDEVNSQGMNTLNDPMSQQHEWLEALIGIQALDEKGFGDNGLSLSEVITGDKTPESEATTQATKLFQARMQQQSAELKKADKENLDENYKSYQAMSKEELKTHTWASIVENIPANRVAVMRTLYHKAEDSEELNDGEKTRYNFVSRFKEFKTVDDLKKAMLADPVLKLNKWDSDYEQTVTDYLDWEKENLRLTKVGDLVDNQLANYDSVTDEDLLTIENIITLTKNLDDGKGLTPGQVISLTKRKSVLKNNSNKDNFASFITFMEKDKLTTEKEPELRKQMRVLGLDNKQVKDVLAYRKTLLADPDPALKRKKQAGDRYAYLSNPENEEELLKLDLSTLKDTDVLKSEEGYARWQDLIKLKRAIKLQIAEVKITEKRERSNRTFQWLTQGPLANALLRKTDLTNELQILNGWSDEEIQELRSRQITLENEQASDELLEKLNSDSLAELVRLHKLGDALTKEDLNKNKKLEEDDLKTAISWQSAIRLRDQTIETARKVERREYWKTHYLADENVLSLLKAPLNTLELHLGKKTPELADVLAKQEKEKKIRELPSNQRFYERSKWGYIQNAELGSVDVATIQNAFPQFDESGIEIGGQKARIEQILKKQTQIKEDKAKEQEIRDKAKLEKAPKILSKQYHSKINEVLMNPSATAEGRISKLREITGEVRNDINNLDESDFSQILSYAEKETDSLEKEIKEAPLYSSDWRPTVTRMFKEQIIYPGDNLVQLTLPGNALSTDIATRTNTQRLKAADHSVLQEHMKGVFDQNPDWNTDQISAYLNKYLGEYSKTVKDRVKSITGLDDVDVTSGIKGVLDKQLAPDVLEKIEKMPLNKRDKNILKLLNRNNPTTL